MEISHASTETQSAAVGINGKAEEVTVSTDAEFMMMIAHGIYSNKALALVRELLCNARDGHAKAGHLDKPIIITLTDNMLVVRDHGTGIPNPIFAPTYMTFGKSTKRKEANQTGGFGVGTKVPWAVCDVFSARNFIEGMMTAYSIIKSDPTLDGKPSCTPVMTIPSTEPSGVEVSVPFPEKMRPDIQKYIALFADELNIPITLNGAEVRTNLKAQHAELVAYGFTRMLDHPKTVIQTSPFYVRQGDVIYPIEPQEEFQDAYDLLNLLNLNGGNNPILFMAEPDSIIPTLSRESLQYTDRTSKSIRDLMKKALKVLADSVDAYSVKTMELFPIYLTDQSSFIENTWAHRFEPVEHLPRAHQVKLTLPGVSDSTNFLLMQNMRRWLMARTPYLETPTITGKDFRTTFEAKIEGLFIEKLRNYYYFDQTRLIEVWKEKANGYARTPSYRTTLLRNAYEEIMYWRDEARYNDAVIEVYIGKDDDLRFASSGNRTASYFIEVLQLKDLDVKKEGLFINSQDYLKETLYVSNTVVISTTPANMIHRAVERFTAPADKYNVFLPRGPGRLAGARCVRVKAGIKPNEVAALTTRYEKAGYTVITLLEPTREEIAERERLAEERAALKAIPLPTLGELIQNNIQTHPIKETKLQRRQLKGLLASPEYKGEPLFYILPRGKDLPYNMRSVSDFMMLARFVGTDIQAVSTKTEIARVIKEGRRNLEDALMDVAKWFYKKPGIHEKLFYKGTFFMRLAEKNKYLTKYLFNRLPPVMTAEEHRIYEGLRTLTGLFPALASFVRQRNNYYESACTSEEYYKQLFHKYAQDNFCDVQRALEKAYSPRPSRKRALARSILKTILKEPA